MVRCAYVHKCLCGCGKTGCGPCTIRAQSVQKQRLSTTLTKHQRTKISPRWQSVFTQLAHSLHTARARFFHNRTNKALIHIYTTPNTLLCILSVLSVKKICLFVYTLHGLCVRPVVRCRAGAEGGRKQKRENIRYFIVIFLK